nr:AraC family transcriptional regulator [uncultured Pseudodesulfovibrio sp.]
MGKTPTNTDVRFWRDPDLPGVEARYSSYNEDAFRKHTHAAYSIGIIETGKTTFTLNGEAFHAGAGQLVLIEPEVVHVCNPDLDSRMTYRMFYVESSWLETVGAEMFGREIGPPSFPLPVVDDPGLVAHWQDLHEVVSNGGDRLEKESLLVEGLADLLLRYAECGEVQVSTGQGDAILAVKRHLAENLAEKVSLDALSKVAHVSRYHLLRTFQASVGLSPHAYQNQLRVDLGKKLLAENLSISHVAVEAGFVDQSHFSRVFKQYTGATPQQYQAGVGDRR